MALAPFNKYEILTAERLNEIVGEINSLTGATPPAVARLWTGGVTATTIEVNFDVTGTTALEQVAAFGIIASIHADLSLPVFELVGPAPATTVGSSGRVYYTCKFTITGLTANTQYYIAATFDDVIQYYPVARIRTAPTNGTARTFNFIVGSCSNPAYLLGNPYAPAAALAPAFVAHIGDMAYSDISLGDPGLQRDTNTRQWRSTNGVQALMQVAPIIYMPDDHDFGPNNNHWDLITPVAVPMSLVGANTRLVVRETTPRYPEWDTMVLSQSWTWGRVRFLLPDLRSQRRYTDGGPTFLGDGIDPPTGYDHKAAVLAAIDQASIDGMKMLVFLSTSTWTQSVFDSWEKFNSVELTELADKFRDSPVHVMVIHGDAHQCVIDDGTTTDRSSTQSGKLPMLSSSGWNWGVPFHDLKNLTWDGTDGDVTGVVGNATAFVNVTIEDNGGDDIHWKAEFFGAPLSGSSATSLGVYRDTDASVVVGFSNASDLPIVDGENAAVAITKSWLGPVTGCTVDYSWASGPSGTLAFPPNSNIARIPRAFTDGTPDTVTLSNPVRCTLGANTTKTIDYFTPEAELTTWLAAIDVYPAAEIVAGLNLFILGLKADSLWTQIIKLYWLGAHSNLASRTELKTPADHLITVIGAPSYTPMLGWRGKNAATDVQTWLDTGYTFPAGNRNTNAALVRTLDAVASFSGEFGSDQFYINPYSTSSNGYRMRSSLLSSGLAPNPSNVAGSIGFSRTGSANYKMFRDGLPVATIAATSAVLSSGNLVFCGFRDASNPSTNQSGGRRLAVGMISNGMTDADMLAYYNRETDFLQFIGVVP